MSNREHDRALADAGYMTVSEYVRRHGQDEDEDENCIRTMLCVGGPLAGLFVALPDSQHTYAVNERPPEQAAWYDPDAGTDIIATNRHTYTRRTWRVDDDVVYLLAPEGVTDRTVLSMLLNTYSAFKGRQK